MPGIGPMELVIGGVIALLILGPKRLPDAGRALGQSLRGFRHALDGKRPDADEPEQLPS
jgi:sec-independent protein translocase protein TatA